MNHLILYDGVCGFCQNFVRLTLDLDREEVFAFASLQSEIAGEFLGIFDKNAESLETFYIIEDFASYRPLLHERGEAVVFWFKQIPRLRFLGTLLSIVPRFLLNGGYRLIVKLRYKVFGKVELCPLPHPYTRRDLTLRPRGDLRFECQRL